MEDCEKIGAFGLGIGDSEVWIEDFEEGIGDWKTGGFEEVIGTLNIGIGGWVDLTEGLEVGE